MRERSRGVKETANNKGFAMRLKGILGYCLVCTFLAVNPVTAQDPDNTSDGEITTEELLKREKALRESLTEPFQRYEAQLQAVNKTRFPEEKNFVLEVVVEVQEKRIPKNAVDSAWLWTRKNRPNSNYPFVYFERILQLEGERLGFEVPPFDRNIYSRFRFGTGAGIPGLNNGLQNGIRR